MAELATRVLNKENITQVETLISKLRTLNVKQNDKTRFRYKVAGRFGNLASHLKTVDDELKVAIATTIAITDGECCELNYGQLLSALTRNPALTKKGSAIYNSDTYTSTNFNVSLWATEDEAEIKKIESMIKAVIKDEDIIKHLESINAIATVGATSGSPGYWKLLPLPVPYVNSMSDREIGVLRYPDLYKPYFQVYKVVLKATRVDIPLALFGTVGLDRHEVKIDFECHRFDANKVVIDKVAKIAVKEASKYVDDLFA